MEKNINKIIKRLLSISQLIIDEFLLFESLTVYNMEESDNFNKHLTEIKGYMNEEAIIINNLSNDNIIKLYDTLSHYDDNSDAYNRLCILIEEKYNDLIENSLYEEEDSDECNYEDNSLNTVDDIIDVYLIEEEISNKEATKIIDDIALRVLKSMYERINTTYADNKNDIKYKKRLIKQLKVFKYFVFQLDPNLERIGVNYRFNVDNIPLPYVGLIDEGLVNNQCIASIHHLYDVSNSEFRPSEITEALFNMMSLEEYLGWLDLDGIERLIEMCEKINTMTCSSYGNIALKKLLIEKKKK